MSTNPPSAALPDPRQLEAVLAQALDRARQGGATQAEAGLSMSRGYSLSVRKGEVESLEFQNDRDLGVTVYIGRQKGHASTGDLSPTGIAETVQAACDIARATGEDPCNGLADAALMAREQPDLDLHHPWALTPDAAVDVARECEATALAVDARITQSEGASIGTHEGVSLYANSHGFLGLRRGTQHSMSCAVVAGQSDVMQRDYWYTHARRPSDLMSAVAVGRRAGQRTVTRLGARTLRTQTVPVLLPPELARGFWGHFIGAISGGALYRKASFLLDSMDRPVFSSSVRLEQQPHLRCGASSAAYDSDGVATQHRLLVDDGVLRGWLLGSYSARKLGLQTTGNAGGVFNLVVKPGTRSFNELIQDMGTGLLVTEFLGSGVNGVTGDYSRGAAGLWIENGAIAYPVQEITLAGNLREMFQRVRAIGCDVDTLSSIRTGSVLIDGVTVAGSAA